MKNLRLTPSTIDVNATPGVIQDLLAERLADAVGEEVITADRRVGTLVRWTGQEAVVFTGSELVSYPPLDVVPVDSDLAALVGCPLSE
jgi:hypothetical protein